MKIKMILKKGMVFLFAAAMAVTGVFSLGVMAASGLEGEIGRASCRERVSY